MPTMTVEQMEEAFEKAAAIEAVAVEQGEEVDESFDSGLDLEATLWEALDIMKRCAIFLDYAADPVLVHNLTKQHRAIMNKLSNSIYDFAEEVEQSMNEMVEE